MLLATGLTGFLLTPATGCHVQYGMKMTMHIAPITSLKMDRCTILVYRYWRIYGDQGLFKSERLEIGTLGRRQKK